MFIAEYFDYFPANKVKSVWYSDRIIARPFKLSRADLHSYYCFSAQLVIPKDEACSIKQSVSTVTEFLQHLFTYNTLCSPDYPQKNWQSL